MELLSDFGIPEHDPGEWYVYHVGRDAEGKPERVEFLVRQIPASYELGIERKHSGLKTEVRFRKGGATTEYDGEKTISETAEKALYALLDSRKADVRVGDVEAAAFYSKVMGTAVEPG